MSDKILAEQWVNECEWECVWEREREWGIENNHRMRWKVADRESANVAMGMGIQAWKIPN